MGTRGYFAYRYKRKYCRQYLRFDAYLSGHGQQLADTIPQSPAVFQDWVIGRIKMLENAKLCDDDACRPYDSDGIDTDQLDFKATPDMEWTFPGPEFIEWTYVIDLDNLAFTINGAIHLRLDNMPPDLDNCYNYKDRKFTIPPKHLTTVDLWPAPKFDMKKRQQKYDALRSIIVPAREWNAPTWEKLTPSQRFSVEITHRLLDTTSGKFARAYCPSIREDITKFCWNVLYSSVPALPLFQDNHDFKKLGLSNHTLGFNKDIPRCWLPNLYHMGVGDDKALKSSHYYCRIRGSIVTFCVTLGKPIYVAHEVERLVQRMRRSRSTESTGIILSSQQELVVVAVDGAEVRHSPVLDIRVTFPGERDGRASDGRLLLTYFLSPYLTAPPLPWRTPQPYRLSSTLPNCISKLPPEILQIIVHYADMGTYLSLCRVSRATHLLCVANPRVGDDTVLHRIPEFETVFAARSVKDGASKFIRLSWGHTAPLREDLKK